MKRGGPRHPKVSHLATLLGRPKYAAVGIVELLFHFTAEFAHAGDIGKFEDEAIAAALCWDGDSTMLVSSLVQSRWLDACPCHRLRVHDWPEHADQTVQRVLSKRNQWFLTCYKDASMKLASSYDRTSQPYPFPLPYPSPYPLPIPHPTGVSGVLEPPVAATVKPVAVPAPVCGLPLEVSQTENEASANAANSALKPSESDSETHPATQTPSEPSKSLLESPAYVLWAAKEAEKARKLLVEQAEAIYATYPRKVGRPKALASITKAIADHGFDVLLNKTQAYAAAVSRWPKTDLQFVPHPTTWFNQSRFNDDPATWERKAPAVPAWKQIIALTERIKRHPANSQWIGYDPLAVTREMEAELRYLRAELSVLQAAEVNA